MQPGTQLGHYEIVSVLGKGGMGEVWRALDQKLGREVAIKTLPEKFAQDEERLARFEREAKLLASLNHPNIATIHGLEEHDGTRFLVLELVEGDTLAERLRRGAIPVEESLKLALQIAEALEAAHEKGVIHRDLKPANIKVTPDGKVKVLDFGLAKAFAGDGSDANLSQSPTLSMAATQKGVILGTAAYMSPEQASGDSTDKRADIWSFGVVLFEMVTGRQTFDGKTVAHVLADVLRAEPEWSSLPPNLHPRLRLLLERCLEKEAKDRCHDIADVRVDIQKVLADPDGVTIQPVADVTQAPPRLILRWIVLAVAISVVVAGGAGWYLKPEPPRSIVRFYLQLPEGQEFTNLGRESVVVSHDGSKIVYVANEQLYLRRLEEMDARPIQGTDDGARTPFFSPNSLSVGYWSGTDQQLKKIAISGGVAVPLCDAINPGGASWGTDGTIVFGQSDTGLMGVSENGGSPQLLVERDEDAGSFGRPHILPGGQSMLFVVDGRIAVQSLETGARKELGLSGLTPKYVPTGHLIYGTENELLAVPFDLANLEVTGDPVSLVEGVWRTGVAMHYDVSDQGLLVYLAVQNRARSLVWVDREGGEEVLEAPLRDYSQPSVSPEGTRVAVHIADDEDDIWIWDLERNTQTRLTFDPEVDRRPIWTPDGDWVVFASNRDGAHNLFQKKADNTGQVERLTTSPTSQVPNAISPDGKMLVLAEGLGNSRFRRDLSMVSLEDGLSEVLLDSEFNELAARISPDGGWIAYTSNESGQLEIYVRPFPDVDSGNWTVSIDGGDRSHWGPNGRELFYLSTDQHMMRVPIRTEGGTFSPGNPEALFSTQPYTNFFDVSEDGQRFLMIRQGGTSETRPRINIVENWFEELKERVPVP